MKVVRTWGARMTRQGAMTITKIERIQERFERARRVNCLKPNESANLLAESRFAGKSGASMRFDVYVKKPF